MVGDEGVGAMCSRVQHKTVCLHVSSVCPTPAFDWHRHFVVKSTEQRATLQLQPQHLGLISAPAFICRRVF